MWAQRLREAGLEHQLQALDDLPGPGEQLPGPDPRRRPLGVLLGTR
jgi:hypothetical protein